MTNRLPLRYHHSLVPLRCGGERVPPLFRRRRDKVLSRTRLEYELEELASSFPDLLLNETPLLSPSYPAGASNSLASPPPAAALQGPPSGIAASPAAHTHRRSRVPSSQPPLPFNPSFILV